MKFKPKRHIVTPLAIVVYTIIIATYSAIKHGFSSSYWIVIVVNLTLAVALYFILKKRDKWRKQN